MNNAIRNVSVKWLFNIFHTHEVVGSNPSRPTNKIKAFQG